MLPINRVVLFKHGVAYYQREGKVCDNEVIQLTFKSEQMNDVLKSLTTLDYNGGSFSALTYDSEEPIERRLAELTMQIPDKGAVVGFLDQLKGVDISAQVGSEIVKGAILGVESITAAETTANLPNTENSPELPYLAILTNQGQLRHFRLLDLQELTFTDLHVQRELNSLMDTLAASIHKGQKRLSVQAVGEGEREVSISYVVESPVWKTSYRLVMQNENDEVLLQGWAMVDNTTEEDWQDVNLSLVAGLPISFKHDLYSPRYQQRPEIKVSQEAAVAPPLVESGMRSVAGDFESTAEMDDLAFLDTPVAACAPEPMGTMMPAKMRSAGVVAKAMDASVSVQTRTQEVGNLFSYDINKPVSVGRGCSALVPILQSNIDAKKVLYFNSNIREKNPLASFFLKNTSQLTLEGGPITVFDAGNYVGEAMLDTLKADAEKIVPYSVELGVVLSQRSFERSIAVTSLTKSGSYIQKNSRTEKVTEYTVESSIKESKILYFDHRFEYPQVWEGDIKKPDELIEITDHYWRYAIDLPANKTTKYEVVETHQSYESVSIPGITHQQISSLVALKLLPGKVKKQLEEIAVLCEKQSLMNEKKYSKRNLLENIEQSQERLRKNISALGGSQKEDELRERYVLKLTEQEDEVESILKEIQQLEKDTRELDEQIRKKVDFVSLSE
ncbi:DUF4139 domain-containing protein [Aliikangiella sp. IMCC44359]|uniref:DUF4139 domain-containing protein n=1 Tax=Aliikangiella sp. IMCC44359 TaxID=3459125 RepID=UPI00403B2D72